MTKTPYFYKVEDFQKFLLENGPLIVDDFMPEFLVDKFYINALVNEEWKASCYKGTSMMGNDFISESELGNMYEQFQFIAEGNVNQTQGQQKEFLGEQLDTYHVWSLPLTLACMKLGINYTLNHLIRLKTNLQTRAPQTSKGKYNFPHVDVSVELNRITQGKVITAIYYVNDSDGETCFFDKPWYEFEKEKWGNFKEYCDSLNIVKKIHPKKGRMVFFNSGLVHAGCHPIEVDNRIVTNYNFIPNKVIEDNIEEFHKGFI